jgi:hypothetical protein
MWSNGRTGMLGLCVFIQNIALAPLKTTERKEPFPLPSVCMRAALVHQLGDLNDLLS